MKVAILLTLLAGSALAIPQVVQPQRSLTAANPVPVKSPKIDLCPTCISFAGQAINELLNIILNAGVVGSCSELCQLLEKEVPSELIDVVCNLLCDYVGIEEFIKLIEKADLDPIYYCELLKLCPVNDNGDAKINSIKVTPNPVPGGSKFSIEVLFTTRNGTGTGETDLLIQTVDGIPVGDNELSEPLAPGQYNLTWSIKASPDPSCDPTQGPCEQWLPGMYTANVALCNGECGSKHPHSQVYDQGKATFNVTGN